MTTNPAPRTGNINLERSRERIIRDFKHLLSVPWEAAGIPWTDEHDGDVERLVDELLDAVETIATEEAERIVEEHEDEYPGHRGSVPGAPRGY